jgi:hypothetical protein
MHSDYGFQLRKGSIMWSVRRTRSIPLRKMVAALVFFIAFATPAFSRQGGVDEQKITYLIASVAALQDAKFIRNGAEYDAGPAAEHLRLKLRNAGNHVKTAEDFIVYCGTGSSMSGTKYQIRFRDGQTIDSAVFLRQKLAQFKAGAASDAP